MVLTILEQSDYDRLVEIQKNVPALTFKHEPYQEWIPSTFTEEDKNALNEVKSIMKKAIAGFSKFTNFYYSKNGDLRVRFYYDWSFTLIGNTTVREGVSFVGVGYLELQELLNGFNENTI